jgi:hypothetical protein
MLSPSLFARAERRHMPLTVADIADAAAIAFAFHCRAAVTPTLIRFSALFHCFTISDRTEQHRP